jgi:hypothetical protein
LLEIDLKGFLTTEYTSIAQWHKAHKKALAIVRIYNEAFNGEKRKAKPGRVKGKKSVLRSQYMQIIDNTTGEVVREKRYKLAHKRNNKRESTGKLRTGKAMRNKAREFGIAFTRHDIVPIGEYTSNDGKYSAKVSMS